MNKAKPFLFWIISGVIILVELVLLLFISPTGKNGSSPQDVKASLDKQNERLTVLYSKAQGPKGQPTPASRVFNAEDTADIKDLTTLWLPTPQWKKPLEEHVGLYNQQLPAIATYLSGRSAFLHQPIADASDKFTWYETYARLTGQMLQALNDKGCLVLPAQASATAGAGEPPALDFSTADSVRRIAGFYTKGTSLPDPSEYPALTLKYHIVEMIALALLDNPATNKDTPIAPVKTQHEERAALASVEWKAQLDTSTMVVVTLHGPLSALLAAEGALEQIHDGTKPIVVVTGGTLTRKVYLAGERSGSTEEMVTKLTLEILDFSEAGSRVSANDIAQPIVPLSPIVTPAPTPAPAQVPAQPTQSTAPRPNPVPGPGPNAPVGGPSMHPGGGPPGMPPGPQTAPGGPKP